MMDRFPVPAVARSCWKPAADIYRTEAGWLIKIELAGVSLPDLQIQIEGNELLVAGRRRDLQLEIGWRCYSLEISYDRFERRFRFPCDLSPDDPQVRFEDGMLWLQVQNCPDGP